MLRVNFSVVPDMSARSHALYHYLGNGFVVADSWYRELNSPEEASGVSEFVNQHTDGQQLNVAADFKNLNLTLTM